MNFRTYLGESTRSPEYDREYSDSILVNCGIDVDGKYDVQVEVSFSYDPYDTPRNRTYYGNVDDSKIIKSRNLPVSLLKQIYVSDYDQTETKNGKILIDSDVVSFTLDERGKLEIVSFNERELQLAVKAEM